MSERLPPPSPLRLSYAPFGDGGLYVRSCRPTLKDSHSFRATCHASVIAVLQGLPLPRARAFANGAGDKQRTDAQRFWLFNIGVIHELEEKAEAEVTEAETTLARHPPETPEFYAAVLTRLRSHEYYQTATILRVFRGADQAQDAMGIDHEEQLWRGYYAIFMVRVMYGRLLTSPISGSSNGQHVGGFPTSLLTVWASNAAAWAQMIALPEP